MPIKKNVLSEVGPLSGQLKSSFSSLEKTQINALRGMSGSVSPSAGRISGDVSNSFNYINNTSQGRMAIGANIAAALEDSGLTSTNSRHVLSNTISPALSNHRPIHKSVATTPLDLSDPGNRRPTIRGKAPKEIMQNKQRRINGSPNSSFPEGIEKQKAYVKLQFVEYNRDTAFNAGSVSNSTDVKLPLPDNLSDGYNIKYNEESIGFLGDPAAQNIVADIETAVAQVAAGRGEDAFKTALNTIKENAKDSGKNFGVRKAVASLDLLNDITGISAGSVVGSSRGMIPNPHATIFFQGMDLRTFEWSWKLVPRNAGEAASIKEIIKKIKNAVLPGVEGINLTYPNLLKPAIEGEAGDGFGEFRYSMVHSFNINYAGEGASAFFRDGKPVSVIITLGFREVDIVTSDS